MESRKHSKAQNREKKLREAEEQSLIIVEVNSVCEVEEGIVAKVID